MKSFLLLVASCISSWYSIAQTSPCKEVVGYYPNWQWYDRNKLVNPQTINYSKYTILNYSFFEPLANGNIKITDPWADKNLLLGPINWAVAPAGYDSSYDFGNPAYHQPNQKMSDYCHLNGVKFLPSIGGWTLSNNFPVIAADPIKREAFAQSCVDLINAFNFDGIDLDWEYPGYTAHGGTAQDKVNFTLLLNAIRTKLNLLEQATNKEYILTIAVSADPSKMDDVEWNNVAPLVDLINLMSYDFFGAFDNFTNHNSPLYAPVQGNSSFNASSAVESLVNSYSVDPQKITLGCAFYGRSQKTNGPAQLHISSTGQADLITFQQDEGTPLYYNILLQQNLFTDAWDDVAKVPYLTGNNGLNTFLSYDNELSIQKKAEYVVEKNLKGAIIWEITGDYIETSPGSGIIASTPLVNKINDVFCNYEPADTSNEENETNAVVESLSYFYVSPNPCNNYLDVHFSDLPTSIEMYDIRGKKLEVDIYFNFNLAKISTFDFIPGTYILELRFKDRIVQKTVLIH